jgi:DNA-binding NarL/FixJ family response regulator
MSIRILVADDNALVRGALSQVLQSEGQGQWEIVEAENGEEALIRAKEVRPDLIILDLAMPLMDGFRTARELGEILPGVPILMHTLYWSPRVELEALKVGVRKTVAKSDSSVLISAVKELLVTPIEKQQKLPDAALSASIAQVAVKESSASSEAAKSKTDPDDQGELPRQQAS